jgi:hypothetical protein
MAALEPARGWRAVSIMDQRPTPEFFCGSAIAALTGLLFGLLLHTPWEKHPGGPQILFSTAAAAELARPAGADDAVQASTPDPVENADLEPASVTPAPLPVTRLSPEMFDVQPAAADEAERRDVGDLTADAVPPPCPRAPD